MQAVNLSLGQLIQEGVGCFVLLRLELVLIGFLPAFVRLLWCFALLWLKVGWYSWQWRCYRNLLRQHLLVR